MGVLSNPSESIDYTLTQNNMAMKYPPFPEDVQHLALAVWVQRPPESYVEDLAATTTKTKNITLIQHTLMKNFLLFCMIFPYDVH